MKIFYRISDAGYRKEKPEYIDNEKCLRNFCNRFHEHVYDIRIIADNVSDNTLSMIKKYIDPSAITQTKIGHGAGTFNVALDKALLIEDDEEIVYFVENDYLHREGSLAVLKESLLLMGAPFVTLYDHPDKYIDPSKGGNPYCSGGGEVTKVFLGKNNHYKVTNSTTMTFAAKVGTIRQFAPIMRKHTAGTHPNDFQMFLDIAKEGGSLLSPIPGMATHGESAWLAPLYTWESETL